MFTLDNVISKRRKDSEGNWEHKETILTEEHIKGFVKVFGSGCRADTKIALYQAAKDNFSRVKSVGILRRVMFDDNEQPCTYCAGQNYPGEVTFVRNHIKKFY